MGGGMVTVRILFSHPEADLAAQGASYIGQLSVWKKIQDFHETSNSRIISIQYKATQLG